MMHHSLTLNPTTLRIGTFTAAAVISVFALGFAPVPQVFYWLGAAVLTVVLTIITGPKASKAAVRMPVTSLFLILIPALGALGVRGTSLMWAVVPVLAFVVGAATWMVATNRYAAMHQDDTAQVATPESGPVSIAAHVVRHEKTAAANDETSATAA